MNRLTIFKTRLPDKAMDEIEIAVAKIVDKYSYKKLPKSSNKKIKKAVGR